MTNSKLNFIMMSGLADAVSDGRRYKVNPQPFGHQPQYTTREAKQRRRNRMRNKMARLSRRINRRKA